jgi:hypothetical protein
MVDRVRLNRKKTTSAPTEGDAVGYKKPPKKHQFKKGVCPNPTGRPRKRLSMRDELNEELSKVVIIDGKRITKQRVWIKSIVTAAPFNLRISALLSSLYMQLGAEPKIKEEFTADGEERVRENFLQKLVEVRKRMIAAEHLIPKDVQESNAKKEGGDDH